MGDNLGRLIWEPIGGTLSGSISWVFHLEKIWGTLHLRANLGCPYLRANIELPILETIWVAQFGVAHLGANLGFPNLGGNMGCSICVIQSWSHSWVPICEPI